MVVEWRAQCGCHSVGTLPPWGPVAYSHVVEQLRWPPEQPLWKAAQWFLKKLKVELPYDPAMSLLGMLLLLLLSRFSRVQLCVTP